jgi:hypothetical protein
MRSNINLTYGSFQPTATPDWLKDATSDLQKKYPEDIFEVIIRRSNAGLSPASDWRIKCLDYPGKVKRLNLFLATFD